MTTYLFNPFIFLTILGGLFIVSLFIVIGMSRQDGRCKDLERSLSEEKAAKNGAEKNIVDLRKELDRLKNELSIKEKMYEGLKGQYNELEKDFERTCQNQNPPALNSAPAQPIPAVKSQENDPEHSIIDLLKSLNKSPK